MTLNRREFARKIGLGALGAIVGGRAATALPASADADVTFVNPELRPFAQAYLKYAAGYQISLETLVQTRKIGASFQKPFGAEVPVEEKHIPVASGVPDVLAYLINAKPGSARPGILHMHGGGFVLGTARDSVSDLQLLATELDCTILTVDYRLAPETRYTGSIEDNYAGLRWMHLYASELGVDPARIAVMGESAGGGHAALLAITARDRGEVPVLFQCLIYPMLDDRTASTRQPSNGNMGRLMWTPASNRFGWESFLGQAPGTDSVPAAAVPTRTVNLAGLPPAFIGVGSIDLFADEDIEYAHRLVDAGIQTELHVVPGAFHGFDTVGAKGSPFSQPGGPPPVATKFTAAKVDALKRAFAGTF
jgi:acetyl esterase/lipase